MRQVIRQRLGVNKPSELIEQEEAGRVLLNAYCRAKQGNSAFLARKTDLMPATVSNMSNGKSPINIEAALLLEVATDGVLLADKLCPGRADLLAQFLQLRTEKPKTA